MFSSKNTFDIEPHLRTFTHCRLILHSTDDYYVGIIRQFVINANEFTLTLSRISRCREFVIDYQTGEKKFFPLCHLMWYQMNDFSLEEVRAYVATTTYNGTEMTWRVKLANGDELMFTKDPEQIKLIMEILNKPRI